MCSKGLHVRGLCLFADNEHNVCLSVFDTEEKDILSPCRAQGFNEHKTYDHNYACLTEYCVYLKKIM